MTILSLLQKKMNAWALQNETGNSLRYAVSLRFLGNSFYSLSQFDSALFYWNKSLQVLGKQQRVESLDAANCLNYIGILFSDLGDFKAAEFYYKKAFYGIK